MYLPVVFFVTTDPSLMSVNTYQKPQCLQETVGDLWHLITHRVREKLRMEGAQPPRGSLGTHFGDILAEFGGPANEDTRLSAFELRVPYVRDKHVDLGQTIEEAGLTPNAVVIFQRRERHVMPGPKG